MAVAGPLPEFTLDPNAAGLDGSSFTADAIKISDYSTVTFDGSGGFSDTGLLSVGSFQLSGTDFTPTGLNSTYGMYFAFTGAGTTNVADPASAPTIGQFTSLDFTLYGYNGTASFGFTGNTPTETATNEVTLATGTLVNGFATTNPTGNGSFVPTAYVNVTFAKGAGGSFFVAPENFYTLAEAIFSNTTQEVQAFDGGFRIFQGGGTVNFMSTPAVPEPETYALLLGGLAAVGFVARRRRA